MARKLRIQASGATYHVWSRGVAGLPVFNGDPDRERFLWLLSDCVNDFGWACHAYCLLSTHYHLLVRTPEPNIGTGMKRLNGVYAQGFNRLHKRFGHVFAERYGARLVETELDLLEACRYLALNPVRAGLCVRPESWPWSSYRIAIGLEACPEWLNGRWLVSLFGPTLDVARRAFVEFVCTPLGGDRS